MSVDASPEYVWIENTAVDESDDPRWIVVNIKDWEIHAEISRDSLNDMGQPFQGRITSDIHQFRNRVQGRGGIIYIRGTDEYNYQYDVLADTTVERTPTYRSSELCEPSRFMPKSDRVSGRFWPIPIDSRYNDGRTSIIIDDHEAESTYLRPTLLIRGTCTRRTFFGEVGDEYDVPRPSDGLVMYRDPDAPAEPPPVVFRFPIIMHHLTATEGGDSVFVRFTPDAQVLWEYTLDGAHNAEAIGASLVDGGLVVLVDDKMFRLDLETGEVVWENDSFQPVN